MSKFSSIKIISHCFHVYKNEVEVGIVNDIIIDHDLVVQLGIQAGFKRRLLQGDDSLVQIKETSGLVGQTDLTSFKISKMVMNNSEPASKMEATDIMVKIFTVPMKVRP